MRNNPWPPSDATSALILPVPVCRQSQTDRCFQLSHLRPLKLRRPTAGSTSRKRRLELREPSDDDEDESEGEWEPSGEEDAAEEELPEVEVEAEDVVVDDDDDDDTPVVYAEVVE